MCTTLQYHIGSLGFLPDYHWEESWVTKFQRCWITVEYRGNKYHTLCCHTKVPVNYIRNCAKLPMPNIEETVLLCWQQKGAVLLHPWGMNPGSLQHTSKASNKHMVDQEEFPSLTVFLCTDLTLCWCLLLCWTLQWDWALCAVISQVLYVPVDSTAWDRAWGHW